MKTRKQKLFFGMIAAAYLITRLFRLDKTPAGINIDELGSAYDAMCIGRFGMDRYLTHFPPYFKNYGGGQSALLIYLGALLLRFTSFSLFRFRVIPVLVGFAALICAWLLGKEIFEKEEYALVAPALFVVMPEFLMTQRWALDCNLFLSMSVIVFFFLVRAVRSERIRWYSGAGIICGITLYTYAMSYLVLPLFLLILLVLLIRGGKMNPKRFFAFSVPLLLLAAPLLVEQLVNAGIIGEIRTGFMDFLPMGYYRGGEFSPANIGKNIIWIWKILIGDNQSYASIILFGTVFYCSIPFLIIGLLVCIRGTVEEFQKKEVGFPTIVTTFYFVSLFVMLLVKSMNVSHANQIFASFLFFTAYGLIELWKKSNRLMVTAGIIYALFFLVFSFVYYGGTYNRSIRESDEAFLFVKTDLGKAVRNLDRQFEGQKPIYILADEADDRRILLALYNDISPQEFAQNSVQTGNYFIEVPEELDTSGSSVYVIGKNLHHVTDYLASIGFTVDDMSYPDYSVIFK